MRSWKRSISLAALVAVTCGALQAATPNLEQVAVAALPAAAREARLQAPKVRAALRQQTFGLSTQRAARRTDASLSSATPDPRVEPRFEPLSLAAGLFGVIVFVASRRRAD